MIHIKTCLYSSCTALHFKSPLWWCAEAEMQKFVFVQEIVKPNCMRTFIL